MPTYRYYKLLAVLAQKLAAIWENHLNRSVNDYSRSTQFSDGQITANRQHGTWFAQSVSLLELKSHRPVRLGIDDSVVRIRLCIDWQCPTPVLVYCRDHHIYTCHYNPSFKTEKHIWAVCFEVAKQARLYHWHSNHKIYVKILTLKHYECYLLYETYVLNLHAPFKIASSLLPVMHMASEIHLKFKPFTGWQ